VQWWRPCDPRRDQYLSHFHETETFVSTYETRRDETRRGLARDTVIDMLYLLVMCLFSVLEYSTITIQVLYCLSLEYLHRNYNYSYWKVNLRTLMDAQCCTRLRFSCASPVLLEFQDATPIWKLNRTLCCFTHHKNSQLLLCSDI